MNVSYRLGKVASVVEIRGEWLDLGCADGGYSHELLRRGATHVVGVDVDSGRVEQASRRHRGIPGLEFGVAASEELPYADEAFDGVLMNEVFEHVRDEARTLQEVRRILRAGGHLVVISPNRWFPFEGHGISVGGRQVNVPFPFIPWLPGGLTRWVMRARNYWPHELRELVSSAGFDVVCQESVFPVFEVYPWLPRPVADWYRANLDRIDDAPILRRFGVSTLVVGRRGESTQRRATSSAAKGFTTA